MRGKKETKGKMIEKKKDNRGGLRSPNPGGRPKKTKTYSDKFKRGMWQALERQAKASGKSIYDLAAERLYSTPKNQTSSFVALLREFIGVLVEKESKQTIEKVDIGPQVMLPPIDTPDQSIFPVGKELVQ